MERELKISVNFEVGVSEQVEINYQFRVSEGLFVDDFSEEVRRKEMETISIDV